MLSFWDHISKDPTPNTNHIKHADQKKLVWIGLDTYWMFHHELSLSLVFKNV